jgi:RND family efflux transporter MFP subunit
MRRATLVTGRVSPPSQFLVNAVATLATAALGLLSAGCQQSNPGKADTGVRATPPNSGNVTVVKPQRQTIRRSIEQPGTVEPFERTPVYAKIAGYVRKVNVDIGDRVKEGQELAELWVPELEEEWKQKQALVAQTKAEVTQGESALAAARASYDTAVALVEVEKADKERADALAIRWQSEYQRLEPKAKTIIDKQQLDETRFQWKAAEAEQKRVAARIKSAEAAVAESKAKIDKADADVVAAKARRGVAEADERRVKALLDYAKILAPFDGVVTARNVDTDHFVQPSGGATNEPLFVVVRQDVMRLFVDVPEPDAPFIGKNTTARIRPEALKGLVLTGKVTRTARALAPKVRTLRTEIDLLNTNGRLLPGMYFYATLTTEHTDVWAVPMTAIVTQNGQTFCFRVVDGKAGRMPIEIGLSGGGWIEVLKKQTQPAKDGESIWEDFTGKEEIVANAAALTDGQKVTVAPAKP